MYDLESLRDFMAELEAWNERLGDFSSGYSCSHGFSMIVESPDFRCRHCKADLEIARSEAWEGWVAGDGERTCPALNGIKPNAPEHERRHEPELHVYVTDDEVREWFRSLIDSTKSAVGQFEQAALAALQSPTPAPERLGCASGAIGPYDPRVGGTICAGCGRRFARLGGFNAHIRAARKRDGQCG